MDDINFNRMRIYEWLPFSRTPDQTAAEKESEVKKRELECCLFQWPLKRKVHR
jgi:hypothetical protein